MLPHHLGKHNRRRVDHLFTGHRAEQALPLGGHAVADKVLSAVVHPDFRPLGANAGFHRLRWFIGRQEFRLLLLSRFGRARNAAFVFLLASIIAQLSKII